MAATIEEVGNKAFDYIIVGGGTSGLALAARLTEDESTTVLVLEAGGANIDVPDILRPAQYGKHFSSETFAYRHKWIKQKYANDRESVWERGKGLGGSSGINFQCYLKPPARDIDDLERLGNPGWNWKNYQKYGARAEGWIEPSTEFKERNDLSFDGWKLGTHGPLSITYPTTINEGQRQIRDTFINAGLPKAPKPLDGDPHGVTFVPNTYDPNTHTRAYSVTAYYLPNKHRKNLTVMVNATVHRVRGDMNNGTLTVTGVEFEHDTKLHIATTKREVIISAGSLQSPHILEQSGIGSAKLLKSINIPVRLDLPGVGENLQEHICVGTTYELKDSVQYETVDILRDPRKAAEHLELHTKGTGIHTSGIIGITYATMDKFTPKADVLYKVMEDMVAKLEADPSTPPGLIYQYKITLERFKPGTGSPGCELIDFPGFHSFPNPPELGKRYVTIFSVLDHCWSRGSVHSVSNDPRDVPEIDPHYFERSVDLEILLEMVKWVRNVPPNTLPFKDMIVRERNPGPAIQTDEELRDWIKATFSTIWHTSSTCSMLPREMGGVVDHNLKVYGTSNLRVVDLSVLPLHIAAHPQATVYAFAEQAADIIKGRFTA